MSAHKRLKILDPVIILPHQDSVKKLVKIMALLAVLLQGIIPLGFMPGKAAAGTAIVICSGLGMKTVIVDDNDQPQKEKPQTQKSCDFALSAPSVHPPQASLLSLPDARYISLAAIFSAFAAVPSPYSLPDKTGPPSRQA